LFMPHPCPTTGSLPSFFVFLPRNSPTKHVLGLDFGQSSLMAAIEERQT
jgi:hypothetical protein